MPKEPKYLTEEDRKTNTINPNYRPPNRKKTSAQAPTDLPISSLSSGSQSGANTGLSESENIAVLSAAEKEYKRFLEEGLVLLTWLVGMLFGLAILGDMEVGQAIFTMQDEEVDALAPPLASYLAKQKIPARVRKLIISSNDALAIIAASLVYVQRVGKGVTEYARQHPRPNQQTQAEQGSGGREAEPGTNGHAGIPDIASLASLPAVDPEFAGLPGAYIR